MHKTEHKLVAVIDMGTTNTRLSLLDESGATRSMAKGAFGVKDCAAGGGRAVLIKGLQALTRQALDQCGLMQDFITIMLCSGMITSEIGLKEIPHRIAPVGISDLAANAIEMKMPEIGPMPILFIPGVKNRIASSSPEALPQMDFMRGEETQVFGAMDLYDIELPATFMFLSSHTKLVDVDGYGSICESFTTLSGQIFDALRYQSLLASSLPTQAPPHLPLESLKQGVQAGLDYGLQRAALLVRFMDTLQDTRPEDRFAFLEGIVLASDLRAMRKGYPRMRPRVYILGNRLRAEAYQEALKWFINPDVQCAYLGENSMDEAAKWGAWRIAALRI
jgi:2-dehydro-3-deoxygalactonokinase